MGGVHDEEEVEDDDAEDDEDADAEEEAGCILCSALSGKVECSASGVVSERMRACPGFECVAAAAFRNSGFEWYCCSAAATALFDI